MPGKGAASAEGTGRFAQDAQLYALCDGMGGGPQGEEAACLAVGGLGWVLQKLRAG